MHICTYVCIVYVVYFMSNVCAHCRTKRQRELGRARKGKKLKATEGRKRKKKVKREQKPPSSSFTSPRQCPGLVFPQNPSRGGQIQLPLSIQEAALRDHQPGDGGAVLKHADPKPTVS